MQLTDTELAATRDKVAKLNARAANRGWTGRVTVTSEPVEITETGESGLPVTRFRHEVTIDGEAPCYDAWTFLAKLDWDPEAGLIVSTAPGVKSVDRDGLVEGDCDHCKRDKANRRHCYLVRHADGRQLQVGSTCIKDFLGWQAHPAFVSDAQVSDELESCWGGSGGREERYSTETVLAAAWACIREFGWHPASSDSGTPTKYTVADVLDPRGDQARELSRKIRPHVPDAVAQAGVIRDYILSDAFSGDSEYVINLRAVAAAPSCPVKNFGLLVSAPQTWARSVERDLRRQAENANRVNEWAGEVGDKIEATVTIKSIRYLDGDYGTTTVYTLAGEDGRTYKWFASRSALGDEVTGQPVKLKGTIKKLDEYQGAKSTSLIRCKVIETEAAPAVPIDKAAISAHLGIEREAC
jgi:hypothetical protein